MGILVYGVEYVVILCGGVWVFYWFHLVGIGYRLLWFGSLGELFLGFYLWVLDGLGLRHRLLWFWVFGWVFPRVLPMGLG